MLVILVLKGGEESTPACNDFWGVCWLWTVGNLKIKKDFLSCF